MVVLYKDEGNFVVIAGVVVEELKMLKELWQTGPVKGSKWEAAGVDASSQTWRWVAGWEPRWKVW